MIRKDILIRKDFLIKSDTLLRKEFDKLEGGVYDGIYKRFEG